MRTVLRIVKIILISLLTVILLVAALVAWNSYQWKKDLVDKSFGKEVVSEEVNLSAYRPFAPNNLLAKVEPDSKLKFTLLDAPSIDGATAAYPVYAAAAQALYSAEAVAEKVKVSKTSEAYQRLINREVDVIFAAQASQAHRELATKNNIQLNLTPVGKEAFVFLVSKKNPLNNLTAQQIRDIYAGRIKQWNEIGGSNENIMAFQRPENSGSQTVMLDKVMRNVWVVQSNVLPRTVMLRSPLDIHFAITLLKCKNRMQ
jgi:phosphate transport system substrate-binding protein